MDDEFGGVAHKDKGFADWVIFWKKGDAASAPGMADATTSTPVDAATEAQRIANLTGNQPVVISRNPNSKIKLPGL